MFWYKKSTAANERTLINRSTWKKVNTLHFTNLRILLPYLMHTKYFVNYRLTDARYFHMDHLNNNS